jgi:hypothetical protein
VILALSAAVAAAAAAPHSPVRLLLARATAHPAVTRAAPPGPVAAPTVTATPTPAAPRGVAISSPDHVDLIFRGQAQSGLLRIRSDGAADVSVTASTDGPTYTVGSATIVIDPHGTPAVTYDVELPPPTRLARVSVRVGDRIVFARHGSTVLADRPPQADGSYLVELGH